MLWGVVWLVLDILGGVATAGVVGMRTDRCTAYSWRDASKLAAVRQSPDNGHPLEHGCSMGRGLELAGQILSRRVHHLVAAFLPKETSRNVVDLPLEGNVGRSAAAAMVLRQLVQGELEHPAKPGNQGGVRKGSPRAGTPLPLSLAHEWADEG
jgi:hypothetical protein